MNPLLVPMVAVGAIVVLAIVVVVFRWGFPAKREIGYDFFGSASRSEESAPAVVPMEQPEVVETTEEFSPMETRVSTEMPEKRGVVVSGIEGETCCVCGGAADEGVVTMEQWERAERLGDWLARILGATTATEEVDKRRRLYEQQGWCRSCASIAQPLDRRHRDEQQAKRLVEDRQWEREGLRDAVKEIVEAEQDRYRREQVRKRARAME